MAQYMRCQIISRAVEQCTAKGRSIGTSAPLLINRNSRCIQLRTVSSSSKASNNTHENFTIRKAQPTARRNSSTLVVLFGFYRASESAIKRYCDVYHKYGFDVVYVKSVLKHFSWPKNSVLLADSLLGYLEVQCSNYDRFLVHAFSMGAYNFTVCMASMYDKPEMYARTQGKICGLVYDSLTIGSLENMSVGVASGLTKNALARKMILGLAHMYFSATYKNTVMFYDHYVNLFKVKPLPVATLFFYCRNDPMSEAAAIEALFADWRKTFSFHVISKGWDDSKHAAHLLKHGEEYLDTLDSFLRNIPALTKELKPVSPSKL